MWGASLDGSGRRGRPVVATASLTVWHWLSLQAPRRTRRFSRQLFYRLVTGWRYRGILDFYFGGVETIRTGLLRKTGGVKKSSADNVKNNRSVMIGPPVRHPLRHLTRDFNPRMLGRRPGAFVDEGLAGACGCEIGDVSGNTGQIRRRQPSAMVMLDNVLAAGDLENAHIDDLARRDQWEFSGRARNAASAALYSSWVRRLSLGTWGTSSMPCLTQAAGRAVTGVFQWMYLPVAGNS